ALGRGLALASFAGNESFWQVRLAPDAGGRPGRVVICYKGDAPAFDPLYATDPTHATVRWRDVGRPENAFLGIMYGSYPLASAPLVIEAPANWALAGTGLAEGDIVSGVFGYESDHLFSSPPGPPAVARIGSSLTTNLDDGHVATAHTTSYDSSGGGYVFA